MFLISYCLTEIPVTSSSSRGVSDKLPYATRVGRVAKIIFANYETEKKSFKQIFLFVKEEEGKDVCPCQVTVQLDYKRHNIYIKNTS